MRESSVNYISRHFSMCVCRLSDHQSAAAKPAADWCLLIEHTQKKPKSLTLSASSRLIQGKYCISHVSIATVHTHVFKVLINADLQ